MKMTSSSSSISSSIRLITLLIVLVLVSSLYKNNISNARLHRSIELKGGPLGNMGSDLLSRPEDEDSPEFAEYLKQLMSLQVNRAKAGFSAPSSGSSDAYLAKLNRIKVERMALRKAGLPEDLVDTSYKKEDYVNALQESAEPLVSSAVLTGEAAIATPGRSRSGTKSRPLTDEEIAAAKSAEELVAKALARNQALPPDQQLKAKEVESIPIVKVKGEDLDVINNVLTRSAEAGNSVAAKVISASTPSAQIRQPAAPSQPSYLQSLKEAKESKIPQNAQVEKRVESTPKPIQQPKPQPVTPPLSSVAPEYGRKLKVEELEVAAKALQLLVKHRGGGPFGVGRLVGNEVNALEKNLRAVYSMLENDKVTTIKEGKVIGNEVKTLKSNDSDPLPDLKKAVASQAPSAQQAQIKTEAPAVAKTATKPAPQPPVQKAVETPAPLKAAAAPLKAPTPVKAAAPTQSLANAPSNPESPIEVPISAGLEQFLQSPQYLSIQELNGLRDGLIQCLSMIQMEIMKRPADATNSPPKPLMPQAAPVDNMKVLERVIQTNENLASDEIEKDMKIALGLLLKHRGGPGFGHGRLEGRELILLEEKLRNAAEVLQKEAV